MSLSTLPVPGREFVLARVIHARRPQVFKAWLHPAQLARWWGPMEFTNPVCAVDARVGGEYRIVMRSPDGVEYPMRGVYKQIATNEKLAMTVDCHEHPDHWHDLVNPNRNRNESPAFEAIQSVAFEDLDGKTRITIRMIFDSPEILQALYDAGINEGWNQSLDRLNHLMTRLHASSPSPFSLFP